MTRERGILGKGGRVEEIGEEERCISWQGNTGGKEGRVEEMYSFSRYKYIRTNCE